MDQFKQASKLGLRFNTDKGVLTTEQLWSLTQTQLSLLIRSIRKVLTQGDDDEAVSFLTSTPSKENVENQLRFDIAKEIYLTKKQEAEELRDKAKAKEDNEKIMAIIARKRDSKLEDMSEEELVKLLK